MTAPTTQNLWGVCFGNGQFVAVGEGGTILTSPEGVTWTSRSSGTTAWLNGVTFANQLYVAVGSEGTILTSPDGVTWTRRAIGGPRLNGVAYGNARFLAVGEDGTCQVSTDGFAWTAGNAGTTAWLRGITFAQGNFIVTGRDGRFLTTTDGTSYTNTLFTSQSIEAVAADGEFVLAAGEPGMFWSSIDQKNWTKRALNLNRDSYLRGATVFNNTLLVVGTNGLIAFSSSRQRGTFVVITTSSTAQFNAVAGGTTSAVSVGHGGTIFRSAAENSPPSFVEVPKPLDGVTPYVASQVTFVGSASGAGPMTYQWNFNGTPIAGATSFKFVVDSITSAQSGRYSVTATNPRGSAESPSVLVSIRPAPANIGVDPNFKSPLGGLDSTTSPIVAMQPDGRILLGGPYTTAASAGSYFGLVRLNANGSLDSSFQFGAKTAVSHILLQPSGRIIVNASARLNADGSLDPTFNVPSTLRELAPPMVLLADGRLLALTASSDGSAIIVTRLSADGAIDGSFPPRSLPLPPNTGSVSVGGSTPQQTTDAYGRIVVTFPIHPTSLSLILRFFADGQPDFTFTRRALSGEVRTLQVLGTKPEVATVTYNAFLGSRSEYVFRLNEDGSDDASFTPISYGTNSSSMYLHPLSPTTPFTVVFTLDGSVLTVTQVDYAADNPALTQSIDAERYDSSGTEASGSVPVLDTYGLYIRKLLFLPSGQMLAVGDFPSLGGVATSKIARLNLSGEIFETRLSNLSIRTRAGADAEKLIAGFVVGGTNGTTSIVARGIGSELSHYGVDGVLTDPHIDLYQGTTVLTSNEDWDSSLTTSFAAVGAFPLTANSKDAAIKPTLGPGVYSLQVIGASTTTGIALAEIYDAGPAPFDATAPRLVNLSGRAFVSGGQGALIAGFVVSGTGIKRLLIRAVGPTLAQSGVTGSLANPELAIYRGAELIAVGRTDDFPARAAALQVGAFAIAPGSLDQTALIDVSAGVYSAQVRGRDNSTGVALVEIYEVPN